MRNLKSYGEETATYVLNNDMGGITSFIKNLIEFRGDRALSPDVIMINIKNNKSTSYFEEFVKDVPITYFNYSFKNNWYYSFKQLKKQIGEGRGVLISNDVYDLIMLTHYNINKKIIQIVHDAYNIKLSIQYQQVIDCFICHSFFYYEMLCQLLPYRRNDIYFLQYGVPISSHSIERKKGDHLKLIFIGRHDKMKGVFDLFEINEILKRNNIPVKWLILGKGPETDTLKEQWKNQQNAVIYTAKNNTEILELCAENDLMIFPTKFEGFPVAMVEAMSVGCIPIVSDLPGGIRELANNGENAILCKLNDNESFARAIKDLYNNSNLISSMSENCKNYTVKNHNAAVQSPKYQELFIKIAEGEGIPLHHKVKSKLGSRLDQPFIPNSLTHLLRNF